MSITCVEYSCFGIASSTYVAKTIVFTDTLLFPGFGLKSRLCAVGAFFLGFRSPGAIAPLFPAMQSEGTSCAYLAGPKTHGSLFVMAMISINVEVYIKPPLRMEIPIPKPQTSKKKGPDSDDAGVGRHSGAP